MSLEGPEIHAPHGHKTLGSWVEILLSLSALVVSAASIGIALHHGKIMEKLVEANSLPYLIVGTSNATPEGQERLSFDLVNEGVGPAHEKSLKVKVGDRYVTSWNPLLAAVFGPSEAPAARQALRMYANQVRTRFVPGGRTQNIFQVARTDANARYWDKLDASRRTWSVETCYCSVFDECWTLRDDEEPKPVKACIRDEAKEFTP